MVFDGVAPAPAAHVECADAGPPEFRRRQTEDAPLREPASGLAVGKQEAEQSFGTVAWLKFFHGTMAGRLEGVSASVERFAALWVLSCWVTASLRATGFIPRSLQWLRCQRAKTIPLASFDRVAVLLQKFENLLLALPERRQMRRVDFNDDVPDHL